jgi:hypothetical protein
VKGERWRGGVAHPYGGEPHSACLGLDSGNGLLRVEPNYVYTRGSR